MIKKTLLIAAIFASIGANAQTPSFKERAQQYILQYKDLAQEEQRRCGIPAAITLGQGILETEAGKSELATQANNHFGIKCKKSWTGETFAHDDDAPKECFRKYPTALHSYKDHSDYLKTSKRYESCFAQNPTDYASWARELRKCGYATNPKYAQVLIKIIEDFQLQNYTYAAMRPAAPALIASAATPVAAAMMAEKAGAGEVVPEHDTPAENSEKKPEYGVVTHKDGIKGFYARRGDVLLEYAIKFKMRYAKLLEINNLPDAPLAADMFVSLENGNRITQIMSRDASEPAPAAPVAPAAAYSGPARGAVLSDDPSETKPMEITHEAPATAQAANSEAPVTTTPQPVENSSALSTKPAAAAVVPEQPKESPAAEPEKTPETAPASTVTAASIPASPVVNEQPAAAEAPASEPPVVITPPATPKPAVTEKSPKSINIADEVAVEEQDDDAGENAQSAKKEEEPKNEFDRLKARLDKVVYAPKKAAPAQPVVAQPATVALAPATPAVQAVAPTADSKIYHTVKSGETAFGIAKKYNLSMKELMAMNNLNFEAIKIGQKLRVR